MRYDMNNPNHRKLILEHAFLEGDDCPVDDICDSMPAIIHYIRVIDDENRKYRQENQRLEAQLKDAERKLKNVRGQRNRLEKRKGKTLYN